MGYKKDNIGKEDRNQGEWDFPIGVTVPSTVSLSGKTASCIIEDPSGNAVESTATISGQDVYHTVAEDELDEVGWFWYWLLVDDGRFRYGPIGVNVLAVPEVS